MGTVQEKKETGKSPRSPRKNKKGNQKISSQD